MSADGFRNDALLNRLQMAEERAARNTVEARELMEAASKDLKRVEAQNPANIRDQRQNAHDEMMIAREMKNGLRDEGQFNEALIYAANERRHRAERDRLSRLIGDERDAEKAYRAAKRQLDERRAALRDELARRKPL
jgi:hypothetical protein